jgi:anti-anti-sigma regulatory factor
MDDSSGEDAASGASAELRAENARLRDQVIRLLRVEADLFRRNEQLDQQWKIYQALSDLGKRFNRGLGLAEIAAEVVQFALYALNLERCVVQIHEGGASRTLASDGYYDDAQAQAIAALSLSPGELSMDGVAVGESERLRTLPREATERDAVGKTFLLDEYAILPFRHEADGTILGFLVAGNTERKAIHHGRVVDDDPVVLALRNLVDLAAVAFRSARLDEALGKEREQLEERVKLRTAELADVNERLVLELGERKLAEEAREVLQDAIIRAQEERILELSTPILPITDEILVMPLVGTMDAARAEQMSTSALEGAASRRARFVIIDITGVKAPDASFAGALERTARGLELLGVRVVVTGIGADVARSLLSFADSHLATLVTRSTLRGGISFAMASCRADRALFRT